ncbi:MAG: hypothetical protein H7A46_00650 [Verrucomicrobiales bacterium]|nr:hypothetical protein [Verrucomicrobiales bacterium]
MITTHFAPLHGRSVVRRGFRWLGVPPGLAAAVCVAALSLSDVRCAGRQVISLDGSWDIGQSVAAEEMPVTFEGRAPVPGLVDMAEPAFAEVGKRSELRRYFWYRRTFILPDAPSEQIRLKLHKAKYGTKVWLNGEVVGEHLPCFTAAEFDVRNRLHTANESNELVIRVGADRDVLPAGQPNGWDFEKYLYLPGIYDSVELIMSGGPRIVNLQTVPDLAATRVRVLAEIDAGQDGAPVVLQAEVREVKSGAQVGVAGLNSLTTAADGVGVFDLTIPITDCRLWSPEDPFLYELTLKTAGDEAKTRFGMRSFAFDPLSGRAMLNGRPYFLRGSNVTLYRFFEDAARGGLPWDRDWVRQLHRKFKGMNWNALRYCIGFPPDFWYDIADEEGILIQDEFPIWLLGEAPEKPVAEQIAPEYVEWMRERWNHPSVVIWDGQNESVTPETGKAIQAVRHLDYSNRPWDNGWAEPQSLADCVEAHPYLFIKQWMNQAPFRLKDLAQTSGRPGLRREQQALPVPILINEYAWLWLTRDGNPTCLTDKVYAGLLGENSTVDQRRRLYARYLAALTEFWRCHRECAGVLHFCGLGYSRPGDVPRPEGGATSDHWLDVAKLEFEPLFEEHVREAFNPVGLMVDFWDEDVPVGSRRSIPVYVINDRYEPWAGEVRVRIKAGETVIASQSQFVEVAGLGREIVTFDVVFPSEPRDCLLQADLADTTGARIRSLRDVGVKQP